MAQTDYTTLYVIWANVDAARSNAEKQHNNPCVCLSRQEAAGQLVYMLGVSGSVSSGLDSGFIGLCQQWQWMKRMVPGGIPNVMLLARHQLEITFNNALGKSIATHRAALLWELAKYTPRLFQEYHLLSIWPILMNFKLHFGLWLVIRRALNNSRPLCNWYVGHTRGTGFFKCFVSLYTITIWCHNLAT